MELADQFHVVMGSLQHIRDEVWDMLDQLVQVHGWTPVFLVLRYDMQQQVSAVCQRGTAELFTEQ